MSPAYEANTRRFLPAPAGSYPLWVHALFMIAIATVASALGLNRGDWMRRVRR